MTKSEFEAGYAGRSGTTVERLHALGQVGAPCDCGEEGCSGWQMKAVVPLTATQLSGNNALSVGVDIRIEEDVPLGEWANRHTGRVLAMRFSDQDGEVLSITPDGTVSARPGVDEKRELVRAFRALAHCFMSRMV